MKSTITHMKGRFSKRFAMLLFVCFCLAVKELKAQREIHPWEPEFDSAYAMHFLLYSEFVDVIHFNQFFSKYAKEKGITKIKVIPRDIITSSKYNLNKTFFYKDGFLMNSYTFKGAYKFHNWNKKNNIVERATYHYIGNKIVVLTFDTKIRQLTDSTSYVFNDKKQLEKKIACRIKNGNIHVSNTQYLYNEKNNISYIVTNNVDSQFLLYSKPEKIFSIMISGSKNYDKSLHEYKLSIPFHTDSNSNQAFHLRLSRNTHNIKIEKDVFIDRDMLYAFFIKARPNQLGESDYRNLSDRLVIDYDRLYMVNFRNGVVESNIRIAIENLYSYNKINKDSLLKSEKNGRLEEEYIYKITGKYDVLFPIRIYCKDNINSYASNYFCLSPTTKIPQHSLISPFRIGEYPELSLHNWGIKKFKYKLYKYKIN